MTEEGALPAISKLVKKRRQCAWAVTRDPDSFRLQGQEDLAVCRGAHWQDAGTGSQRGAKYIFLTVPIKQGGRISCQSNTGEAVVSAVL